MSSPGPKSAHRSKLISRTPFFYGWLVLLAGSFGLFMTTPGQTIGVSVFLDGIIADLELSRTTVSLMYTFATLAGSVALPFVGRFIDAYGPRVGVITISILFALACGFMGLIGGAFTLFLGFMLIRSLGQGSLSLVSLHAINLWFVRRRGLAVGISGMSFALSFAIFPPIIDNLIAAFGWRWTYPLLGLLVLVVMLPIGALLFRSWPETYGLLPDGGRVGRAAPPLETNFTLDEARRTGTFWLYTLTSFTLAMLGTALIFHNYDILGQNGVGRAAATAAFGVLGLVAAATNLVAGILLDRLSYRLMLGVGLSLMVLVLLLAGRADSTREVLLYGASIGLMQGITMAIGASVYAKHFGRRHLGSIRGTVQTIGIAGAALGPFLFAIGLDLFGSYRPVLLVSALLPLLLLVATPFVKPPLEGSPDAG